MTGMPWGGSEVLWWQAAMRLRGQGHGIAVNFKSWPQSNPRLEELRSAGARVYLRDQPLAQQLWTRPWSALRSCLAPQRHANAWLTKQPRPDFLLANLSYHCDPVQPARACIELGIPYAILVHAASSHLFIRGSALDAYREAYRRAAQVFVVSHENLDKIEVNLGMKLPNVELVNNPFGVSWDCPPTWPDATPLRLACVGRIHFPSKGQDLLVDVLRRPHWKDRELEVVLFGQDQGHQRQLEDLVRLYGLEQKIRFGGFLDNMESLWQQHHGLVLCSRFEGAAIAVVEAMLAHRLVIATDTGRNRELIEEGGSGFLADAPTVDQLDAALNRAWEARERWREMGLRAGQQIREKTPRDPVDVFCRRLLSLAAK